MSETEVKVKPKGLIVKLCEVMAEAGYVQKRGRNEKFNYNYATEADVVELLREKLAQRNVFVFPSVVACERKPHSKTSSGADMFITDIMIDWTFLDGDSGEVQVCKMPGCGTDTGDKGLYKAITGSSKYLFLKAFMLPTGDDPENEKIDKEEGKRAARGVAKDKLKEAAKGSETITMTPWKEGRIALSGGGIPIIKAALSEQEKGDLGLVYSVNDKVTHLPLANGFSFQDACAKHQVPCIWMDAPTHSSNVPASKPTESGAASTPSPSPLPKANLPPFVPLPATDSSDPLIVSAKRIQKAGKKEFLAVEWNGRKFNVFDKKVWPHLEHHVNRPAMLTLESKGQYTNLVAIERLDGVDFGDPQNQGLPY